MISGKRFYFNVYFDKVKHWWGGGTNGPKNTELKNKHLETVVKKGTLYCFNHVKRKYQYFFFIGAFQIPGSLK